MTYGFTPGNMKRFRWHWLTGALFLFAVIAVLAFEWGFKSKTEVTLTPSEQAWLRSHPIIRMAPDPNFPPVEYLAPNGNYNGITADYIDLLEKSLGIRVEIVRLGNWDEVINKAKNREIDVYVATDTPQRADYMLFTKPFLEFPVVIIARGKAKDTLDLQQLNGMKVSVVSEYAAHNFISKNYPELILDPVSDVRTGLRKVSFGLSDVLVENLATATYFIEKDGFTNLRIAGDSGYLYRMGFCSRKDWPELNRILEKWLASITSEEKRDIYQKWIPVEPFSLFASRKFRAGFIAAVTAILLLTTAVVVWNRMLARRVDIRTRELLNELAERKRVQEMLDRTLEDLEKRVIERTAELSRAKELLEEEIVERKQAEDALRLYRFCIDKAGIGIFHSDENGTIYYVNDHACKSLDYSREELCALSIFDIDPAISREEMLAMKKLLDESGTVTHHTKHRRKDGTTFPVEITANTLDYLGKRYAISFVKDITERRRAEEALRESETRVRCKLESILDPEGDIGELDLADILDLHQLQALLGELYRISGLKMSIIDLNGRVLLGVGWQDICLKFHRNHPESLRKCLESDSEFTVGMSLGEFRTYRCKNNMWHLVTPIIVGERHMGNLFMGQFFYADEEVDLDIFRAQAKRYGFPEKEYLAALKAVPRHSEELVKLGKSIFMKITDMVSKLSYANIKLAHALAERDRLSEILRQANMVVENSPAALFRWKGDDKWPVELVSGNIKQFGYSPDDFLSGALPYSSVIHHEDLERVTREVHDFCDEGIDEFRLEYRIITRDGDVRWVNELTHVERDAEKCLKGFEGIVIDITERKQMEDELRVTREKYRTIVDAYDGFIYICSQDYRIEFMNRRLIEWCGQYAKGKLCYEALHGRDSICPWCVNERVFSGETVHWDIQCPKDGRWYHVVNVPICNANGTLSKHSVIADIHDLKLTEKLLLEQKKQLEELNATLEIRVQQEVANNREKDVVLIQQNRQAALGEMLDHIAHQWKQPLTCVSLIIQVLEETAADGELEAENIKESTGRIMELLEHMEHTIDIFRGFYRPDKERKVFRIKDCIDQALSFITPALRFHSITVELDVDPALTSFGYPKEYVQALLNILANARDVFKARGTEKPRIAIRAYAEDRKSVVAVMDNGGGIPEDIMGEIFDFYFTTNESGGGTGIGLYMSRNIIEKNMGGVLSAENIQGGALFRIELPLT